MAEGWDFPFRSRKAHYFTEDGRSLCGGWDIYRYTKRRIDGISDVCAVCKKKLKRLREEGLLPFSNEEAERWEREKAGIEKKLKRTAKKLKKLRIG